MKQYLEFLQTILDRGVEKLDRTGVGTRSIFGLEMRFDLSQGFPLLTTKKVHLKSIIYELLWFLQGSTNVGYLQEHGVSIWNEWADGQGNLGPVYGKQWRSWDIGNGQTIDQIESVIEQIRTNPDSRRLIVSAWNVADLDQMALPPCHAFFQFYVADGKLSCKLTQRSADAFLGVPFNIASYAFLLSMVAQQCDLKPGELIWSGGDCHIYNNHLSAIEQQISREPRSLPQLRLARKPESISGYQYQDFVIEGYNPHPRIQAPIAV